MKGKRPQPVADWQLEQGRVLWAETDDEMPQAKKDWLDKAMSVLPQDGEHDLPYRAVVELRVLGKYTFREIAAELGLNGRQNAHDLYTRALRWLHAELDEGAEKWGL